MNWLALAVVIAFIGVQAILAAIYFWADIETRKGRGWSRYKNRF